MNPFKIRDRRKYPYKRQRRGKTLTGEIRVGQVYHVQGWGYGIIGIDVATGKEITLRPVEVLDPKPPKAPKAQKALKAG